MMSDSEIVSAISALGALTKQTELEDSANDGGCHCREYLEVAFESAQVHYSHIPELRGRAITPAKSPTLEAVIELIDHVWVKARLKQKALDNHYPQDLYLALEHKMDNWDISAKERRFIIALITEEIRSAVEERLTTLF